MPSRKWNELLNDMASMYSKDLDAGELRNWKNFLETLDSKSIQWAFDQHLANGRFFPKPAEIIGYVSEYKLKNLKKFEPCGNCEEGWTRVFEGRTAKGNTVDPKFGAVKRCPCFATWLAS